LATEAEHSKRFLLRGCLNTDPQAGPSWKRDKKEIKRFFETPKWQKTGETAGHLRTTNKKDLDFTSKSLFLLEPGKRIELSTY
jgi:hypothetical protein